MNEQQLLTAFHANGGTPEIIQEVKLCPDYFVMEGGADGTWAHIEFLDDFGHLMPEISKLAEMYGGKV